MQSKIIFIAIISSFLGACDFLRSVKESVFGTTIELIPFQSGDKWGYIDKEGNIAINPQFNEADVFIDGVARVLSADNKYGFIGTDGKYKINATYKTATFFSEGLACVVPEDGKPQYINETGEVKFTVSEGKYCGVFREGFARIGLESKHGVKWGYLNKEGKIVINAQFDGAAPFNEGLAAVAKKNNETGETLWGFINTEGAIVINYQFKGRTGMMGFDDELGVVSDGKKVGFIDKGGKYVINPQFDGAYGFKEDLAVVGQGGMAGYIDKKGKLVINPQFDGASSFSGGLAAVKSSDGRVGFIDKDGKYIINPQFEDASDFLGNMAFVRSGDKWGIINREGKYIANPQFDNLNFDFEGYIIKIVESDYFDMPLVVNNFLEGTDDKAFRSLSGSTNISQLKIYFPTLKVNSNGWSANANDNTPLNDHSYISNTQFIFSESPSLGQQPVYTSYQEHDYWSDKTIPKQKFSHYEDIPNDNATLQSVTFKLYLTGEKAKVKSEKIFKAISEELISKASLTPTASSNEFENNKMTVVLNQNRGHIAYAIRFKKDSF